MKQVRDQQATRKETLEVKDESIKDTLLDLANYALITHILYEEVQEENRLERVKEWNENIDDYFCSALGGH